MIATKQQLMRMEIKLPETYVTKTRIYPENKSIYGYKILEACIAIFQHESFEPIIGNDVIDFFVSLGSDEGEIFGKEQIINELASYELEFYDHDQKIKVFEDISYEQDGIHFQFTFRFQFFLKWGI